MPETVRTAQPWSWLRVSTIAAWNTRSPGMNGVAGNATPVTADLRLPAGNRLEALKGDRTGCYSVRVNEQYRITFQFEGGSADAVKCEDYH